MTPQETLQQLIQKLDPAAVAPARPSQHRRRSNSGNVKSNGPAQDRVKEAPPKKDEAASSSPAPALHEELLDYLVKEVKRRSFESVQPLLPQPKSQEEPAPQPKKPFIPPEPKTPEESGLSLPFLFDLVLRTIYNRGRITGGELAAELKLAYSVLAPVLPQMRRQMLIDMVGQKSGGMGDAAIEYEIKPPKGQMALEDALGKSEYVGPAPVPFKTYVESVKAQTIKSLVVTRQNIQKAFADLIITNAQLNEIGPAINSAQSIFLFGFPGNGKTSIAERITRLAGDTIYIPHAIEANGQIIKLYDPIVHDLVEDEVPENLNSFLRGPTWDKRFVKIKRPTIVVGGELTMSMLDLKYNPIGKFYEAPVHMKANGGIFMIDDFGRQQVRAMDLLNRWIIPLEKKYDYVTTVTGTKLEIPFDELLIFSTNLDPNQLADEAFLRRIKFKIEIRDPDEASWRQIWHLVCQNRKVAYDDQAIDYLIQKWYKPTNRPFRACHPRDLLDQMICMAKYNMEPLALTPALLDAACATYFVSNQKKDFGAKVRLD